MSKPHHTYPRTDRLDELFRELLAEGIAALADPRADRVTVTDVTVSHDLGHADVFVVGPKGGDDEAVLRALAHAAGRLRKQVGKQVRLKRLPELRFKIDPSIQAGERVDQILRELSPPSEPGGAA